MDRIMKRPVYTDVKSLDIDNPAEWEGRSDEAYTCRPIN